MATALVALSPVSVRAADLVELQPLTFGMAVLKSNLVVGSITQPPIGNPTYTDPFILLNWGTAGRYKITGADPYALFNLSVSGGTLYPNGNISVIHFEVSDYIYPDMVQADKFGNVTFNLGATLRNTGDGVHYVGAPYSGNITIFYTTP